MRRLVHVLAALVERAPAGVIAATVALTAVFGVFAPRAEIAQGNEGFAPDNEELRALERAGELFAGSGEAVVQVVVRGDDVIGAAGVAAVRALEQAIVASPAGAHLAARADRPPVVHFLAPALQATAQQPGADLSGDAAVDALYAAGLAATPPDSRAFVAGLVGASGDVADARSPVGLMLVFLDTADLDGEDAFDRTIARQQHVAAAVRAADLPAGIGAEPFAFELLFDDEGAFDAEISRLFGMAFLIILVILAFVYLVRPAGSGARPWARSARRTGSDVALTLATIVASITWMQGSGVLLGPDYLGVIGAFSPPTQIVPILLIGLGVDFAIHLTARYREELGEGAAPAAAATRATTTVGVALVLATVTTAVGFLTNVTNPLPALRDFGILAAVGIVAAFVLMLTFVPSVRLLLDRRADRAGRLPRSAVGASSDRSLPHLIARTSVLARRFAVPTLAVTLVAGVLGAWGLTRLSTEFSVTDFVPDDSPLLPTLALIEAEFGGGFAETTQVVLDGDLTRPGAHNALVAVHANLGDTPDVLRFDGQPAARSVVTVLGALVVPRTPAGAGGAPPDPQGAPPSALAQDLEALGLRPDLTVAPDADVAGIYDVALAAAPEAAGRVLHRGPDGYRGLVEVQTQAGEQGAAALAADLRADFAPLAAAGVTATPTSNNIVTAVIIRALQDSQVISLIITLAAALALLVATFWVTARRPMLGVLTTAPVVLVVLWTFGMMAATGVPFGPVTAVLSALAIGIGVPFTIHITHRFQEDRARCADVDAALDSTVRHTGGALAGSALTTMAGFGILVTSSLVPFRQMGQVTVYAIGFSLLAALLVLPSMLALWDRWHRRHAPEPEHVSARTWAPLR